MDKRQEMLYVYVQPFPRVHMSHLAQSVCAICFFHCDKFDCVSYQATATYKSPQPREDSNLIDGHLIFPNADNRDGKQTRVLFRNSL